MIIEWVEPSAPAVIKTAGRDRLPQPERIGAAIEMPVSMPFPDHSSENGARRHALSHNGGD